MAIIRNILKIKGQQVWSIDPDDTVLEAIQLMAEKNVGALLVMQQEKVMGIISERDCARKVLLQEKSPREVKVNKVMTSNVYYARPEHSLEACLAIMTDHRIRHLPILSADQKAVGIVSIGDLAKEIISKQLQDIQRLEGLITGAGYDE